MKRGTVVRLALSIGLLGAMGMTSHRADACGDEYFPAVDYRVQGVANAEQAVRTGHHLAAAGSVLRMIPHIKATKASKDTIVGRARRTLAVAVARGEGSLQLEKEVPAEVLGSWRGKTAAERQQNLDWAIATLRSFKDQKADDPGVLTDLGEALSKVEGHHDEALAILSDLAQRDLMTSAEGYAALGHLRAESGDREGQKLAMQRCEAMTKDAAVCEARPQT